MNLGKALECATRPRQPPRYIKDTEYREWARHACWDRLQHKTLGQSFCEYFGITDHMLLYTGDQGLQWKHIQTFYRAPAGNSPRKSANTCGPTLAM